jgi:uncharacterized protein (TIGR02246 family)
MTLIAPGGPDSPCPARLAPPVLRHVAIAGWPQSGSRIEGSRRDGSRTDGEWTTHPPNAIDEDAIRAIHQQMIDAWNSGSGTAFAAPFTNDADFVVFEGTHLKGRQEIASFTQQILDTVVKGSRLEGEVKFVRFLSPQLAVMHSLVRTTLRGYTMAESFDEPRCPNLVWTDLDPKCPQTRHGYLLRDRARFPVVMEPLSKDFDNGSYRIIVVMGSVANYRKQIS